ncbi:hypothetical protein QTI66_17385 [Variovorax sp. J22R133]|uniref:hypothetical protein n=1 Tax=Variovorax brevis TaxID=3053503 RepID=UPI002578E0D8|nr:hypothetical protein [Variovorax sp. J22R133]MDM0113932.1 hypothetical protein [Variovorax sp. J22R133]
MRPLVTIFCIALAAVLTGCASTKTAPAEILVVDTPALNTVATAELGETLVKKGISYVFDGLELRERITDNGAGREYVVEPGRMAFIDKTPDGASRYEPPAGTYYVNDKIFGRKAFPKNGYVVVKANGTMELQGYYDLTGPGSISPANPKFSVGKIIDSARPNFRQELIYGGRLGDQIKVTYREFSGDMLRSAFSQDVQYDLTTEKIIGFKGVRIEVVAATNTKLEYRVLKSFPDPL